MKNNIVRVLIVDDSALVRTILSEGLNEDPRIKVVGLARDPYEARDLLVKLKPDVMTLDVEMPRMDGVTFLRKFMPVMPTPTIVLSSLTQRGRTVTLDALAAGAVETVAKPSSRVADGLSKMLVELRKKVISAAVMRVAAPKPIERGGKPPAPIRTSLDESTDRVIAIGASTGGVGALMRIIPRMPAASPGVVIVQHMPAGFTKDFATRLNEESAMSVKEAEVGDRVMLGQVLVAPGDRHMEVQRSGGQYRVRLFEGAPVSGHVPSVDVMFRSVATHVGNNAVAALLTGLGADGAEGLLEIKKSGGATMAQDEATSVVYGMPRAAAELGAAQRIIGVDEVPGALIGAARLLRAS